MSDFECASINAAKAVFLGVTISLCFFHLMQTFRRQADSRGLKLDLNENDLLSYQFKKLKLVYLNIFIHFILEPFRLYQRKMFARYGRSLFLRIQFMMVPSLQ